VGQHLGGTLLAKDLLTCVSEPTKPIRSSMVVWCALMASSSVFVAASASSPLAMASLHACAARLVSAEADGAASISSTFEAV
jgi:hypothetical protein